MVSEEDCINALRKASDELGKSPTISEYQELDISPSKTSIIDTFGSWNKAKDEANLDTYFDERKYRSDIPTLVFDKGGGDTVGTEYVRAHDRKNGESVRIHRLIAVALYGFDAVANNEVHHKSGHGLDNRHDNLDVIDPSTHRSLHRDMQVFERGEDGRFKGIADKE